MIGIRRLASSASVVSGRGYHHGYVRKATQTPWKRIKAYSAAACALALGYYVYQINLETVPITGRKQFMLYLPQDDLDIGK